MSASALPPLLLRPHYVCKPWGGRRLATDLGRCDVPDGSVGESWEVYDLPGPDGTRVGSRIDGGPHEGRTLADVLGAPVPLLLKVLDAREDLSVQIHPDGAAGKEEAWVALADGGAVACAQPGAVLAGDDAAPGWLERLAQTPQQAGDSLRPPTITHVPPGTVHAILAGTLLLEVQNPVDVTWRLDDHGRVDAAGQPRPLHRSEAAPLLARPTPEPVPLEAGGCALRAERFVLEALPPGGRTSPEAQAAFFLREGTVSHGTGETFAVPAGRTVWLPAPVQALSSDGWIVIARAR